MPWAGACKHAYARLSSAEPREENGKDYVNICHSMCIKNFLKLPFSA